MIDWLSWIESISLTFCACLANYILCYSLDVPCDSKYRRWWNSHYVCIYGSHIIVLLTIEYCIDFFFLCNSVSVQTNCYFDNTKKKMQGTCYNDKESEVINLLCLYIYSLYTNICICAYSTTLIILICIVSHTYYMEYSHV